MKYAIWILALAVSLSPTAHYGLPSGEAFAAAATSTTGSNSSTSTQTCTDNRTTYRGHTDNNCYAYDTANAENNQRNTQNTNRDTNEQGAQQSSMMGMMAMAMGMGMMAAGAAMMANPPTAGAGAALVAAGAMLMAAGMAAMNAAQKMDENADKSDYLGANMDNLAPTSSISGPKDTSLGSSKTPELSGSGIKIDPSLMDGNEKVSAIFDDFENKTGISRADLIDGLNNGKSPVDMLADSSAMKKAGFGADKIGQAVADANASGNLPSGEELLDKLGMSAADLAALAAKNSSMGSDGAINTAGGSSSRSPASGATPDYSFNAGNKQDLSGTGHLEGAGLGSGALSADVQSALDRSGITSRSLFQMVRDQYKKKTPMMFGAQERKTASHADNPFADLKKDDVSL